MLALAACSDTPKPVDKPGATAPVELGEDGVVFYRGNGAEPDTLDPHRSEETGAAEVLVQVGLAEFHAQHFDKAVIQFELARQMATDEKDIAEIGVLLSRG